MYKLYLQFYNNFLISDKTIKFIKFMFAGGPAFLAALLANHLLVNEWHINMMLAYAIVIALQLLVNFFCCRFFVFTNGNSTHILKQLYQYYSVFLLFRLADWCIYGAMINFLGIYFLIAQIINVCLFSLIKYKYARRILE